MWADWSDDVQTNVEPARAYEIVPPPAEVEVTFLLSDPGMLAPHQGNDLAICLSICLSIKYQAICLSIGLSIKLRHGFAHSP